MSTEMLVTELQGSKAIIASIAAQANASADATPLTSALEAMIANKNDVIAESGTATTKASAPDASLDNLQSIAGSPPNTYPYAFYYNLD